MSDGFLSRKDFLKKLWWILLIPYVMMMALMTRRHTSLTAIKEFRIRDAVPEGISFYEEVVCIKEKSDLKFFNSRCTHLGCRINKADGNKLVCPCHGSEFDLKGKALKGPANKSLRELEYVLDEVNSDIIIKLV